MCVHYPSLYYPCDNVLCVHITQAWTTCDNDNALCVYITWAEFAKVVGTYLVWWSSSFYQTDNYFTGPNRLWHVIDYPKYGSRMKKR